MSIDIIVAVDLNGGIGYKGDLLIKNKFDMKRFREKTLGQYVLMGKNTWESLPSPLKNRKNFILTRNKDYKVNPLLHNNYDISILNNLEDLLYNYNVSSKYNPDTKNLICAGGGELYNQILSKTDRVFLTLFHEQLESDTKFDMNYLTQNFTEVKREELVIDGMWVDFIDYVRKENV